MAFKCADINLEWHRKNEKEIGVDKHTGKTLVKVNANLFRPAEVDILRGDATKAKNQLGWDAKISLEELCSSMIEMDLQRNKAA